MSSARRLLTLALVCALVAGCGGEESEERVGGEEQSRQTEAQTEAIYVEIGGLKYQVQLSRVLNPQTAEDRAYLDGVSEDPTDLGEGRVWFGVFMRVENDSDEPHMATDEFELTDTQDERYQPVDVPPEENPFAYEAVELAPGKLLPSPGSPASDGTIQGAVLIFEIDARSLQNRPVQLHFGGDVDDPGTVDLDI